ncbi:LysR family transcriptional regulator [Liquorilactobacillus uvarum]|uniref:LysR family transcriptional regulator n=1 Tax=Liquorilactobacillus uvarum TaxID=303240 RepID=UPI00288B9462|nr:LysR family transcriptional regulator [Liquorilactobacillus uvarum]
MTLDQLFYVIELSQQRTLADTANVLHISQSGLSKAVSQLEDELGVKIFERNRYGTELTPEGKELIPFIQEVIDNTLKFKDYATNLGTKSKKEVFRVAFANTILRPFLQEYLKMQASGIDFRMDLSQASSAKVVERVAHHEIDLGFAAINDYNHQYIKKLEFKPVHEGHLRLFTSKQNKILNADYIDTAQIRKQRFVLFDDPYNDAVFRHLQFLCGPLDVILRTSDPWTIVSSIKRLNAVTLARDWQALFSVYSPLVELPQLSIGHLVNDQFELGWVYDDEVMLPSVLKELMRRVTGRLKKT